MTRIFEPLRSFRHLERLLFPVPLNTKHPLSEHCSVIQQPQQTLELLKETLCVFRHWIKPQKWKAALLHLSLMNYAMLPKHTNYKFFVGRSVAFTLHEVSAKPEGQWHSLAYCSTDTPEHQGAKRRVLGSHWQRPEPQLHHWPAMGLRARCFDNPRLPPEK